MPVDDSPGCKISMDDYPATEDQTMKNTPKPCLHPCQQTKKYFQPALKSYIIVKKTSFQ
uniref:Uncharacterized protein n=1 Tax=Anguilla anguilla TaxID=7936 RepID=A0A0E9WJW7_ANGAN